MADAVTTEIVSWRALTSGRYHSTGRDPTQWQAYVHERWAERFEPGSGGSPRRGPTPEALYAVGTGAAKRAVCAVIGRPYAGRPGPTRGP
jgi:hypothetical protein